jgi:hypothetical protein
MQILRKKRLDMQAALPVTNVNTRANARCVFATERPDDYRELIDRL